MMIDVATIPNDLDTRRWRFAVLVEVMAVRRPLTVNEMQLCCRIADAALAWVQESEAGAPAREDGVGEQPASTTPVSDTGATDDTIPGRGRIPADKRQEIANAYGNGESLAGLTKRFGVHAPALLRILKEHGVPTRPPGRHIKRSSGAGPNGEVAEPSEPSLPAAAAPGSADGGVVHTAKGGEATATAGEGAARRTPAVAPRSAGKPSAVDLAAYIRRATIRPSVTAPPKPWPAPVVRAVPKETKKGSGR